MKNEIIRAIIKASFLVDKLDDLGGTLVTGVVEDMADEIMRVLGKSV